MSRKERCCSHREACTYAFAGQLGTASCEMPTTAFCLHRGAPAGSIYSSEIGLTQRCELRFRRRLWRTDNEISLFARRQTSRDSALASKFPRKKESVAWVCDALTCYHILLFRFLSSKGTDDTQAQAHVERRTETCVCFCVRARIDLSCLLHPPPSFHPHTFSRTSLSPPPPPPPPPPPHTAHTRSTLGSCSAMQVTIFYWGDTVWKNSVLQS